MTSGILRLLALVNDRRREDVSLSAMSALAHRSPFNLHRWFVRVTGETPKAYTARVRLSRAAADLLATDRPVSEIASRNGFAGHEVFTRAFTRRFGMNPSAYRARGLHGFSANEAQHAGVVESVTPCVRLYHTTITERGTMVPSDIAVKDLPAFHALVLRKRIARHEVAETLASFLPAIFGYAERAGLALTGPPFSRYPEVGMGSLVIEGGFPVAAPPDGEPGDGIEVITIPAGPAAIALHRGPYERLHETYQAIEVWLREQGREAAGPPWETYLTDPGERPDPETWETEVVQPIG